MKTTLASALCALALMLSMAAHAWAETFPNRKPVTFDPLVADPEEHLNHVALYKHTTEGVRKFRSGAMGLSGSVPIMQWPENWLMTAEAAFYADFDMQAPANEMMGMQVDIGAAFSAKEGDFSQRVRLMHRNTHVAEYVLLGNPALGVQDYSSELVEWTVSWDEQEYRYYMGGSFNSHTGARVREKLGAQFGFEYRDPERHWHDSTFIYAMDVRSYEEHNWDPGVNTRMGYVYKNGLSVLFEYHDGFVPFGKMYEYQSHYYGIGFYLGL